MNYAFLTEFSYTLFTKLFLLIKSQHILDSPWCYNSCYAYQELAQGNIYSFISSGESFLLLKLSTACYQETFYPHEKSCLPDCFRIFHVLAAETLSLIVYVTKWPFISLLNLWFLFVNISGKLFSINNHFKIPLFQVNKHCSR